MSAEQSNLSIQDEISAAILQVLRDAHSQLNCDIPAVLTLERPKNRDHGDYATSIALALSKPSGIAPRKIAEIIVAGLKVRKDIAALEIAGPGFVNITLDKGSQGGVIANILAAGKTFGHSNKLNGVSINLEFISANPTGPLHLGHTRWAAVGDSLARIFEAQGASVTREYYFNDHGAQIDRFARSLVAAARNESAPEDGYAGDYINQIAESVLAQHPDAATLPDAEAAETFRAAGVELMFAEIRESLEEFGVHFDVFFHENSLYESGAVQKAIERLRGLGHIYEQDGAIWLRSTTFGDDRDRVVIKSDGEAAYIAGDLAYYLDKRERGFDICIYMLGADHHGYIGRLKATAACAGDDPEYNIHVLIGQLVKIMEGGEEVKLSKRAGTIITLEELVEKVGVDAARYTLIRYPVDTPMILDVDVLKRNTNENPVYYVQYAHARIAGVLRNAQELKIPVGLENFDPSQLTHDRENELLGALAEFPKIVAGAAEMREPHRVARYLEELAGVYHRFYSDCRVLPLGDEPVSALHSARANLCAATNQVIKNGLDLLGVSAPERM